MIVKICGIRTLEDGVAAIDAGAAMLGFNFYRPSPRYIPPSECARLIDALRRETDARPLLVGVFVNAPTSEVAAVLDACGLDLAQLHGDEPPEALDALPNRAIKAIRPKSEEESETQVQVYRRASAYGAEILLDASAPGLYGGSGLTASWPLAASLATKTALLLAGGLHPGNVAEAVSIVQPWGVDVASGVESAPGVKDAAKMRLFVEEAKRAAAHAKLGPCEGDSQDRLHRPWRSQDAR